jgi:hypothetical protein
MKTTCKLIVLVPPLLILLVLQSSQRAIAGATLLSPTPTYDPFVEPPLPENPTEYELGRNLYWHWCMTCHGDRGQGLTDEFRGIWEPDHQNCWGRGCHAGRPGDEGFPIPTVVPPLVDETHLVQFASVQDLADFLVATHSPQSPGILKNHEYHAVALFVFAMNNKLFELATSTTTPVFTSIETHVNSRELASHPEPLLGVGLIVLIVIGFFSVKKILAPRSHTPL